MLPISLWNLPLLYPQLLAQDHTNAVHKFVESPIIIPLTTGTRPYKCCPKLGGLTVVFPTTGPILD